MRVIGTRDECYDNISNEDLLEDAVAECVAINNSPLLVDLDKASVIEALTEWEM